MNFLKFFLNDHFNQAVFSQNLTVTQTLQIKFKQHTMFFDQNCVSIFIESEDQTKLKSPLDVLQPQQSPSLLSLTLLELQEPQKEIRSNQSHPKYWNLTEKILYHLFFLELHLKRPYQKISWSIWKTQKTYNQLSNYISSRDKDQCKSHDQIMKQKFFAKQKLDIIELSIKELQNYLKLPNFPKELEEKVVRVLSEVQQPCSSETEHEKINRQYIEILKESQLALMEMEGIPDAASSKKPPQGQQ